MRSERGTLPTGAARKATLDNDTFRTVLFTGEHLQMTVMCLQPGEEIGVEKHDDLDQFIRIEEGMAQVQMGPAEDDLSEVHDVEDGFLRFWVPARYGGPEISLLEGLETFMELARHDHPGATSTTPGTSSGSAAPDPPTTRWSTPSSPRTGGSS